MLIVPSPGYSLLWWNAIDLTQVWFIIKIIKTTDKFIESLALYLVLLFQNYIDKSVQASIS